MYLLGVAQIASFLPVPSLKQMCKDYTDTYIPTFFQDPHTNRRWNVCVSAGKQNKTGNRARQLLGRWAPFFPFIFFCFFSQIATHWLVAGKRWGCMLHCDWLGFPAHFRREFAAHNGIFLLELASSASVRLCHLQQLPPSSSPVKLSAPASANVTMAPQVTDLKENIPQLGALNIKVSFFQKSSYLVIFCGPFYG